MALFGAGGCQAGSSRGSYETQCRDDIWGGFSLSSTAPNFQGTHDRP